MEPLALGAWRLVHAGLPPAEDVVARGQLGRYYDLQGSWRQGLVDELEARWCEFTGRAHTVATSSATQGLALALALLGAGGRSVVVPAYAFAACASSIAAVGARPRTVSCGVRLVTDAAQLAAAVTEDTAAVMAVHMRGIPVDVRELRSLIPDRVRIVEDCSQFDGIGAGSSPESGFSDVSVYSFQAKKLVTAGEGAVLTFDDDALRDLAVQATDSGWFMRPSTGS